MPACIQFPIVSRSRPGAHSPRAQVAYLVECLGKGPQQGTPCLDRRACDKETKYKSGRESRNEESVSIHFFRLYRTPPTPQVSHGLDLVTRIRGVGCCYYI